MLEISSTQEARGPRGTSPLLQAKLSLQIEVIGALHSHEEGDRIAGALGDYYPVPQFASLMAGTMRKETSLDDIFHPPIYRGVSEDVRLRSQSSLPSLDTGNSIVGSESNQSRPRSKSTGEDVLENGGILLETTPDPTEFVTVYDLTEGSHMTMPECIAQCTLLSKTQTPLSASEIQVRHYSR